MNIIKRAKLPTPKFFRILRNAGLLLAGVGASVLASPLQLHHTIVDVAGSVISAVSQVTVDQDLQDETRSNIDIKTKENERP